MPNTRRVESSEYVYITIFYITVVRCVVQIDKWKISYCKNPLKILKSLEQ